MRDSFIFYKSFYEAINLLGEKAQLKLYKSIMKLNFNCCENETELFQLCDEIETELKQNRSTFAQFLLIKPQILANNKRFMNGIKGKQYGSLGGAPKGNQNAKKNNPKTTPNVNENVNVNVNENVVVEEVKEEERKIYGKYNNVSLTKNQHQKLLGICLSSQLLENLIDELSEAIETGREPPYKAELPNAHFIRLQKYLDYRKKNPNKFKEHTEQRYTSKADIIAENDKLIEAYFAKYKQEKS